MIALWRRSAAYRIAIVYSAGFALALSVLGGAVFAVVHSELEQQIDDTVAVEARTLAKAAASRTELGHAIALREKMQDSSDLLYAVFASDRRRVLGTLDTRYPQVGLQTIEFVDEDDKHDAARAFAVALPDGDRLLVALDGDALEQSDRAILALFMSVFVAVIALCAIGAVVLGGYLRARLKGMSADAERIIAGEADARIALSDREDEFDRLTTTLNTMLDRNERLMANLQQVSSDVAHDLRTPLSRLRHRLERGIDDAADDLPARKALADALVQVDRILSLFGAILRISEIEGQAPAARFAPFDASALGMEIGESYIPAIEDSGRTLCLAIAPCQHGYGDSALIAQAVVNLIDNARLHTPVGTAITLAITPVPRGIALTVADDGPGVAPQDRERILQRFVGLDRSRATGGHGLGLNLVAAIATAHGQPLTVEDARPGLRITLTVVRAEPAALAAWRSDEPYRLVSRRRVTVMQSRQSNAGRGQPAATDSMSPIRLSPTSSRSTRPTIKQTSCIKEASCRLI